MALTGVPASLPTRMFTLATLAAAVALLAVATPATAERAILIQEVTFNPDGPFRADEKQ